MARREAKKAPRNTFLKLFKSIAILCLLGYAVFVLVCQQVAISEKKKELDSLQTKVQSVSQQNEENGRLLSITDEKEYIEKIAIERMGYAYPNEIRYYDTSRN